MLNKIILTTLVLISAPFTNAQSAELKVGDQAPLFITKTQDGNDFDLSSRKGKWTVLYFYPKASTPGCTKQACGFRDHIEAIRKLNAEVYGVSYDSIADQSRFHKAQHLNFTLLADDHGKIISQYGTKIPVVGISKRWTFIIDPTLQIRSIDKDVDPVMDAKKVASTIQSLSSP
jgi:peroxiredoxin Q/BCP